MKSNSSLIYVTVLLLVSLGCTKNQTTSLEAKTKEKLNNSTLLLGKWELKQMVAQVGTVTYPSGNSSFLEFTVSTYSTTNSDYSIFVRGSHPKNGHYQIVADPSVNSSTGLVIPSGQFSNRIILNGDTSGDKIFYQITNNKLVILSGYFPLDGGVQLTYGRQ